MQNEYNSENEVLYPLTHPQKRVWYTEKINTGLAINNIGGPVIITGDVDYDTLEATINLCIEQNEVMRLRIIEEDGNAYQYVAAYEAVKFQFIDFSQKNEPQEELIMWADKEIRQAFELNNQPLYYFAFFKLSENKGGYLVKLHHIIADGWSVNILLDQLTNNYLKLLHREQPEQVKYSCFDYIKLEQNYLNSDKFDKNKAFWNEMFRDIPEGINTKYYNLPNEQNILTGCRKNFELSAELTKAIKNFSVIQNVSINTIFISVFAIFLNKYYNQPDVVIGTPVFNRSGIKEKNIFGMLSSTMPFRIKLDEEESILQTVKNIGRSFMKCLFNQRYPYNLLSGDLELNKKGYQTLMDFYVNFYNTKMEGLINGIPIEKYECYNGSQLYKFQMIVKDWSETGNLSISFDYRISYFSNRDIEDIYKYLNCILLQLVNEPDKIIGKISLISQSEQYDLTRKFSSVDVVYPKDKTIYRLFEEQVEKTPDKIAIRYKSEELTYYELNRKANQLARFLKKNGVKPDTVTVLYTIHSIETVIGILAVIKAGGAYLPIDTENPVERLQFILQDSGAHMLLANCTVPASLEFGGLIINLNEDSLYCGDGLNLELDNQPNDLVYIIYTSGSTGKPKGTMIEHRGLVNYISWSRKVYVKDENEVFPLYTSIAFDLTVTSVFTPLICGASIEVYRDDMDEYVLFRILKEKKATVVKCTPAHLALVKNMDNRSSSIKRFIVGGENLRTDIAKSIEENFGGNVEIYNEYGPTETVVGCMMYKFNSNKNTSNSVPIGTPADNVQIYLLDKNLSPVPVDVEGEIYISGDGVSRGYLHRDDLTQRHFIDNPFRPGSKMYRSGDTAKILYSGEIEYIGRMDNQVKVRGYRIELAEIEKCIVNYKYIKEAVVIDWKDFLENDCICAYIVEQNSISEGHLRTYLAENLPKYMIPSFIIKLDSIPLTTNGKVDLSALPKPEIISSSMEGFDKPVNNLETEFLESLKSILQVSSIGMQDNFYHLGGDSIKAIQLSSKLKNKGLLLKVKDILTNQSIRETASKIRRDNLEDEIEDEKSVTFLNTPITAWFFDQNMPDKHYYNQSVLLELKQNFSVDEISYAIDALIKHHQSLRINYREETKELFYNNSNISTHSNIQVYDLSKYPEEKQKQEISRLGQELKGSLNIEKDVLLKGCLFKLHGNVTCLLLTAHHLIIDGVSWRILLEDFYTILNQRINELDISLPRKSHSINRWANALNDQGDTVFGNELEYWKSCINSKFDFPKDYDLGEDFIKYSKTVARELSADETKKMVTKAGLLYNTKANDLLILALLKTIKEISHESKIVLELEGHGREEVFEDVDLNRTVGWLTSIYPVCIDLEEADLSLQIISVKEQLRKIPYNGVGFGVLKYLCKKIDDSKRKYIRFNYLGDFSDESFHNNLFNFSQMDTGPEISKENCLSSLMEINALIIDNIFKITLTYSSRKFQEQSITDFMNKYLKHIKNIVEHCCNNDEIILTPSDFDVADLSQRELDSLFS